MLSLALAIVVSILQLNCNVSVKATTYPAYCNCSACKPSLQLHSFCYSSSWEACSCCVGSFSNLNTSRGPRPLVTIDGVQCINVGAAVYRIPLSGQECTAWLWNPPHGCDSLFSAGFPSNQFAIFEQKRRKKNTRPVLIQVTQTNKRVMTCCSYLLFIWNRAGNDVIWNLTESGIYFTWVLLAKSHTMTNTIWLQAYSGLRHIEMSSKLHKLTIQVLLYAFNGNKL